jgi:GNAT superfamily N-acetyltransferase
VIGFLARDRHDIVALYIHSGAQRQGVGKTLMLDAKQSKAHLTAWSYAQNIQAQNFYQSEGFTEDHRTDGCQNDLKLPDIKYTWNHNT